MHLVEVVTVPGLVTGSRRVVEVLTLAARAGVAPPSDPMETSVWLFGTVATQGIVAIERAMLLSTASMTLGMWAKDEPAGVSELWSALAA